ncbi:MAG: CotH kinase family protein [Candidatus Eisenbacteria sp.]|nr:CotH kinase family protein [Candidatus Eisenbacteria bacterium]
MRRSIGLFCLCACIVTGSLTHSSLAQDCNDLYNPDQVLTLDITMNSADWESLLVSCPEGVCPLPHTYWEAYLSCGGSEPILIGIRRKNDLAEPSEQNPQKVSLKLDINEFVSGQTFAGKKKLSLENGSDGALVTEGMAWQIYQAAGFVAGRSAWAEVYVNGEYKGLYSNVEQVDKTYLTDHGIDNGGFLFKVEEQKTRESETNPFAFCWYPFDHPHQPPEEPTPGDWLDQTLWRVNTPNLLTFAVAENFIANTDGAVQKMTNYYYYDWSILPGDDPAGQQPRLYFPWDLDTTMRSQVTDMPLLDSGPGHLQQGLIEELDESGAPFSYPTFQADYYTTYKDLVNGPLSLAEMLALANHIELVISASMDADPFQQTGSSADAFQRVREFIQDRVASIVSQLIDAGQGFPLETTVVGSGSVRCDPDKPTIYDAGEQVELNADPEPGWEFDCWSGDASGTENPLYITMDQSMSIVAIFVQAQSAVDAADAIPPPTQILLSCPNPFGSTAAISFFLPEAGEVCVHIYDPAGRLVARPFHGPAESGEHKVVWDGRTDEGKLLPPGVYYCRLESGASFLAMPIVRLK